MSVSDDKRKEIGAQYFTVNDTHHDFSVPFNCDRPITVRSLSCNHTREVSSS
ncbi:hypothetical protein H6F61_17850 [Cyanobacteria bacterium FACHB-472]|nr:hypothetical protein [Cyanobacteria bacterium FACHB-472]